ncbi:hypothetical protein M514_13215 [Trichuris suis]|uniref:Uncharacterized protein n=1 Tax=Trichuris suis TaxID=68888 RepID=A0A085N380_9BILA|nr:hypothetical protein M514_13215 [Trichuris suis]
MGEGFAGSAHIAASPAEDPPVVRISSTPKGLHTRGDERSPCLYRRDEPMPGHTLSDKLPIAALIAELTESDALVSAKEPLTKQPRVALSLAACRLIASSVGIFRRHRSRVCRL